MSPSTWSVWICAGCKRRVPGTMIECRCGGLRAHALGIVTSQSEERGSSPGPLALKALIFVAAVAGAWVWFARAPGLVGGSNPKMVLTAQDVPPPSLILPLPPQQRMPLPAVQQQPLRPPQVGPGGPPRPDWASVVRPESAAAPKIESPPPMVTEADQAREAGRRRLAVEFGALASASRRLIVQVQRYEGQGCQGQDDPQCRALLEDIGRTAISVGGAIERTEDIARTSWLDPGVVRDLRREYGLDDSVWDDIERITREYRR